MSKTLKIVIAVVLVVAVAIIAVFALSNNSNKESKLNINSEEDLVTLVAKIYDGVTIELPMLQTMPIDIKEPDMVKLFTGLDSAENLEYVVASEPMMSSQAYSLVLVKTKQGADVNNIAKTMNEKIDARKWLCVTAEKVYTAVSGDVICLMMSNEDTAKTIYESFKTQAGSVSKEYERAGE